jgi:hypothetical protein
VRKRFSIIPTMKRKHTSSESKRPTKTQKVETPVPQRNEKITLILESIQVFPKDLDLLILTYLQPNPWETKWDKFLIFCLKNFPQFRQEFHAEKWSKYESSQTMLDFVNLLFKFYDKIKTSASRDFLVSLGTKILTNNCEFNKKVSQKALDDNWGHIYGGGDPGTVQAWSEGPKETIRAWSDDTTAAYSFEESKKSLPPFLGQGPLSLADPTTILLFYLTCRGIRCAEHLIDYMAYQFGLFYGETGFFWFLFVGFESLDKKYLAKTRRIPATIKDLAYAAVLSMEGAAPCENHKDCFRQNVNKDW